MKTYIILLVCICMKLCLRHKQINSKGIKVLEDGGTNKRFEPKSNEVTG